MRHVLFIPRRERSDMVLVQLLSYAFNFIFWTSLLFLAVCFVFPPSLILPYHGRHTTLLHHNFMSYLVFFDILFSNSLISFIPATHLLISFLPFLPINLSLFFPLLYFSPHTSATFLPDVYMFFYLERVLFFCAGTV